MGWLVCGEAGPCREGRGPLRWHSIPRDAGAGKPRHGKGGKFTCSSPTLRVQKTELVGQDTPGVLLLFIEKFQRSRPVPKGKNFKKVFSKQVN